MSLSLTLMPLLLQATPMVGDGAAPSLNLPMIDRPTKPNPRKPAATLIVPNAPGPLKACLDTATQDPTAGEAKARAWVKRAAKESAASQASAQICLGSALAQKSDWTGAEAAFEAGRSLAVPSDHLLRAQAGAMAGDAALAQGQTDKALTLLDAAHDDANAAMSSSLAGSIALDRARALVALARPAEAASALAEARAALPQDAQVWLLSATLSRRLNDLPQAQTQIETAAQLNPADPEIGLEAGVIAVLSGHDEAAQKSWQSVLTSAPGSDAAAKAKVYLDQLGAITKR